MNGEGNGDMWFFEKWESREQADFHGAQSTVLPILIEKTSQLMQGPPEIHSLVPFQIGGAKGAL